MVQSKRPHHFPEINKMTDTAEFNKVLEWATKEIEDMKNVLLHELIKICKNNDGKIDVESSNFKEMMTSLFNSPKKEGKAVNSFKVVIENVDKYAQKYKLSKESTDKLLTDIRTNVNNFKNILLSNEAETILLLARHQVSKFMDTNSKILLRDNIRTKLVGVGVGVDVDKDLDKRIAEHINLSSAQSIIKIVDYIKVSQVMRNHLARLIPESDIQAGRTQFTEENIRDTAGFISNFCEVFDKRNDIAITFSKSTKDGVNKVEKLCRDEKYIPEILANLFFSDLNRDKKFDLGRIGLYLSDVGDRNKKTLEHFNALHNFHNKDFLDSLRTYLQSFKLPGEAKKIENIVKTFSNEYIKQNPSNEIGSSDDAQLLFFMTMKLNADLHKNQKKRKQMTAEKFKEMVSAETNGQVNGAFLDKLYNSIKHYELRYDFTSERPRCEIRTNKLVKNNTYNKLSDSLYNNNCTAKDIFPNLQDTDEWKITSKISKSRLSKFMGYQGDVILSDKDAQKVTIQIYKPNILSRWFLFEKHKVIMQPTPATAGAINMATMMAASIESEFTSIKSAYDYEKKDLEAKSSTPTYSIPRDLQYIIKDKEEIIKPLYKYKSNFIEDDPMGHEMHKSSNKRKYYLNHKKGNSNRGRNL